VNYCKIYCPFFKLSYRKLLALLFVVFSKFASSSESGRPEYNINYLKDQFYMFSTPNLVFIDGHLSHKVTVFIHDANWEK
jgi:hypothetical protein